jgi:hypothetical protein
MALDAQRVVVDALEQVPQVETLYISPDNDGVVHVVTVIDEDDDETYDRIFEQEKRLIRNLSPRQVAFRIVTRRGRPVQELLGSNSPAWQRHSQQCQ